VRRTAWESVISVPAMDYIHPVEVRATATLATRTAPIRP